MAMNEAPFILTLTDENNSVVRQYRIFSSLQLKKMSGDDYDSINYWGLAPPVTTDNEEWAYPFEQAVAKDINAHLGLPVSYEDINSHLGLPKPKRNS